MTDERAWPANRRGCGVVRTPSNEDREQFVAQCTCRRRSRSLFEHKPGCAAWAVPFSEPLPFGKAMRELGLEPPPFCPHCGATEGEMHRPFASEGDMQWRVSSMGPRGQRPRPTPRHGVDY